MSFQYLMAIAALCGPIGLGQNKHSMLKCQKEYIKCVNKKIKAENDKDKDSFIFLNRPFLLQDCILEKK